VSFPNILDNSGLEDWYLRQIGQDHQNKDVVIEQPSGWEYVYIPGLEYSKGQHPDHIDYWRIPQSLHWDNGMKIAAGWMKWQAGYRQRVTVKASQRYAAVAKFHTTIGGTQNPNAVQWMFYIDGLTPTQSQWSAYSSTSYFGQPTEHQFVFQPVNDGVIDLTFWGRCEWPDNAAEMLIRAIELVEVPDDYGSALPVTPFPPGPAPIPDPDPLPEPTPAPPSWLLAVMIGICGILVALVIYGVFRPRPVAQGVETMDILPINEAGAILMAAFGAILAGGLSAPVTQPVVNLIKFLLKWAGQEKLVSANTLSLIVAGVVSMAIWFSRHWGVELQATSVMDWMAVAIPIVLSGLSMFMSQKGLYTMSLRYKIPVFGSQRTAPKQ
jgi:hypothetical protein